MIIYEIIGGLVVLALIGLGLWKFEELFKRGRTQDASKEPIPDTTTTTATTSTGGKKNARNP